MNIRLTTVLMIFVAAAALAPGAAEAVQLKIATVAPDGSFWMKEVKEGANEIAERTSGRVTIRIYPGGTMGNDQAMLRKMRIGQLHGGMIVAGSLSDTVPDVNVYALPLAFRSYEEVDHVRQQMDAGLLRSIEAAGYVSFGIMEGGFAYLLSNQPITDFEKLAGRKAWIPERDIISQSIIEAGGLSPIPLPLADVLTGLQTGLIDTVAGPPVGAVALQWFTRAKYFTEMPIVYTYGVIVVSEKAFSRIAAADQEIVREVLGQVSSTLDRRTRVDNQGAREALAKQGVQFVNFTEEGIERWREVAGEATKSLIEKGVVPQAAMEQLQGHLETFRAQPAVDP